jgi:hypothetical protein
MARDSYICLLSAVSCMYRCIGINDPQKRQQCADSCITRLIACGGATDPPSLTAREIKSLERLLKPSTREPRVSSTS